MSKPYRTRPEIVGKKLGMTQVFDKDGDAVPVTVIELSENIVTAIKTTDKNGYSAIQIGAYVKKESKLNKPKLGNLKKNSLPNLTYLKEFRMQEEHLAEYKIGEPIDTSKVLVENEKVDVTGKSIGKGFQGMVKLHNKHRGNKTHGSKSYRGPGSIGAHTEPGRVLPGKHMPARMGNENVTARNLKVIEIIKDKNLVLVKGAVPGVEGTLVIIRPSIKRWNAKSVN